MTEEVSTQEEQAEVETTEAFTLEDAMNAALESDEEEVIEEEEVESSAEEVDEEVDEVDEVEDDTPVDSRPEWNDKEKAAFDTLKETDPVAAKILMRRYESMLSGFHEKSQENSEFKKTAVSNNAMDAIFEPYNDDLKRSGTTREQVVEKYIAWEQYIMKSPEEALTALAKQHRIDLTELAFGGDAEDDDIDSDVVKKLKLENQELKDKRSNDETAKATERSGKIVQEATEFASLTDDNGDLLHPHCNEVVAELAEFMQKGMSIADAYDRAVWMKPEIRSQLLKSQTKVESPIDKKARIAKAKRTGRSLSGSNGVKTSVKPKQKLTIDQSLTAAMEQLNQ